MKYGNYECNYITTMQQEKKMKKMKKKKKKKHKGAKSSQHTFPTLVAPLSMYR